MPRIQLVVQDNSGNSVVTNNVTAAALIKNGGTASQFLKADGSVDTNTYATTSAIGNGTLTLAVAGSGLSGSASFTANQAGASTFTVTSNATSANTASAIVARDASGNFIASRITTTGLYGPGGGGNIPIWQYDSVNTGYGIVYNEGSPDTLRIDVSGQALTGTPDVLIGGDYMQINGNTVLHAGNYNSYSPTLTGTGASGSWGISITGSSASTTGNAATATTLQTARTLTVGNTGKSFNGSADVSWSLAEIGALPLSGGTMTGIITTVASGTAIVFSGQTDSIGYNATAGLGTYIKGTGTTYLYGGGSFFDGSTQRILLHAGNFTSYSPTLTGGSASGTWGISITGNAATATIWQTARTITIGSTGKSVNGSADVSWSLAEIGAQAALGFTPENSANKGVANGYASLDAGAKVPAVQLPSYVDDVLEFANLAAFPATGETAKIYVTLDTNRTYRWSGSAYVEISASPGSTDAVTEGTTNLYFTNNRARLALSFAAGSGAYNSSTGVITIPTNTNQLTNGAGFITGYTETDTLATVTARGNTTTANIGAIGASPINFVTAGNTGTWIGGVQDATTGWSLGTATIGFKSDNTTYAAIGIASANGPLYFGRTTASGVGTMASWLTVSSSLVANFTNRPQHGGSNLALVSELPTVNNATLTMNVSGNGLTGSQTFTANQSAAATFTVTSNATNANTGSTVVFRDASGNFSAGTITAALSGNATTATTLQTARTINGVSFNGSANIAVGTLYDTNYRRITNPGGAEFVSTSVSITGAIAITLPVGMTNTMMRMTIKVYEYISNNSFEVHVGGYNYAPGTTWANSPFAYIVGNPGADRRFNIRFGYNSTTAKAIIYIGELGSTWSYPQVFVTELQTGFGGQAETFTSGWSIGFEATSFQGVTATISGPQVGYAVTTNTANSAVLRDGSGNFSAGTITATLNGNAATVTNGLYTTGDQTITGQKTFPSAIASRPIVPGGIISLATGDADADIWGISEQYYPSNPTAADAWGIRWNATNNDIQFVGGGVNRAIIDLDLGNITGAAFIRSGGTASQFLKADGSVDANTYITANQSISVSGDATGSGTTAIALTLATVNSNIGTFNNVTVNAKGLVTAASNVAYLTGNQTITLSGDATGSGATSIAVTLANSGVTAGTYTKVTVDAKGRVTVGASLASADLPTYTGTITSTQVTTALGFTPYNSTNPNGYTSNTGTVTSVSGTGTVSGLTLTGTVTASGSLTLGGTLSASIDNISDEHRLFNNMGDNHSTRTSFDATTASYNFGWRFVQGNTNSPLVNSAAQYYSVYVGLGNDYPATGAGSYGMQLAIPRNVTTPYIAVRYNENNVLAAWQKISAGYADSAGILATARTINGTSFNGSANITTASWGTARTITIGSTGKSVDGSANVSWSLAEIGAQASNTNLTSLAGLTFAATSFVKMTAAGTFALDTSTYYLASNPNGYTTNTGTVTSVALSLPAIFSVTGSPVTTSGTLTASLINQNAGLVFAGPATGLQTTPTFRALVATDIPTLNQNTTGSAGSVTNSFIVRADSGTTEGTDIYTFNGSAAKNLNIVAGTNVTITKTAGQWTIAATGGGGTTLNGTGFVRMSGTTVSYVTGTASQFVKADGTLDSTSYASLAGATFTGQIISTLANSATTGGAQLYLNGTTGNRIDFNNNGTADPVVTTRSAGTKIVLRPTLSGTTLDYAIGIGALGQSMWVSLPAATSTHSFKVMAGSTAFSVFTVRGDGQTFATLFDAETIGATVALKAKVGATIENYNADDSAYVHTVVFGGTGVANYTWYHSPSTRQVVWSWSANTATRTYTLPNASGTIPVSVNGQTADANGNITISTGGGGGYTVTSQTANYTETATSGTKIIKCDTTSASFTVTLPTAVGNTATLIIKKMVAANTLTVDGAGSETIDSALTAVIYDLEESITLISDNANWLII